MAVKRAWVVINGQTVNATYNESTKLWTAELTAPAASSWSQPDHVYMLEVHAEVTAGNASVVDSTDTTDSDNYSADRRQRAGRCHANDPLHIAGCWWLWSKYVQRSAEGEWYNGILRDHLH